MYKQLIPLGIITNSVSKSRPNENLRTRLPSSAIGLSSLGSDFLLSNRCTPGAVGPERLCAFITRIAPYLLLWNALRADIVSRFRAEHQRRVGRAAWIVIPRANFARASIREASSDIVPGLGLCRHSSRARKFPSIEESAWRVAGVRIAAGHRHAASWVPCVRRRHRSGDADLETWTTVHGSWCLVGGVAQLRERCRKGFVVCGSQLSQSQELLVLHKVVSSRITDKDGTERDYSERSKKKHLRDDESRRRLIDEYNQ